MPPSGAIIRGSTGRIARAQDGSIKRCGCCGDEPPCSLVIRAAACKAVLDIDCERLVPPYKWVCVDALCGETPIGKSIAHCFRQTIEGGPTICYCTDPETIKAFNKLDEHEQEFVLGGELDCRVGCDSEGCGDPQADVCPCICASFPDVAGPDSPCCIGKYDASGNVCWNVVKSGYEETTITRSGFGTQPSCPTPITDDCAGGATCVAFRADLIWETVPGETSCNSGCSKHLNPCSRTTVRRVCGDRDGCNALSYLGCGCPNTAPGTLDCNMDTGLVEAIHPPVASPEVVTVVTVYDNPAPGGCMQKQVVTTTNSSTCDRRIFDVTTETWDYHANLDGTCQCSLYQKDVVHIEWEFSRPQQFDPECAICFQSLGY